MPHKHVKPGKVNNEPEPKLGIPQPRLVEFLSVLGEPLGVQVAVCDGNDPSANGGHQAKLALLVTLDRKREDPPPVRIVPAHDCRADTGHQLVALRAAFNEEKVDKDHGHGQFHEHPADLGWESYCGITSEPSVRRGARHFCTEAHANKEYGPSADQVEVRTVAHVDERVLALPVRLGAFTLPAIRLLVGRIGHIFALPYCGHLPRLLVQRPCLAQICIVSA